MGNKVFNCWKFGGGSKRVLNPLGGVLQSSLFTRASESVEGGGWRNFYFWFVWRKIQDGDTTLMRAFATPCQGSGYAYTYIRPVMG